MYICITRRNVKRYTHTTTGVRESFSSRSRAALREVGRVRISVLYANNISVVWHLSSLCSVYACIWARVCVFKPLVHRIFIARTLPSCPVRHTHTYAQPPLLYLLCTVSLFPLYSLLVPTSRALVLPRHIPLKDRTLFLSVCDTRDQPAQSTPIRYIRTCIHV